MQTDHEELARELAELLKSASAAPWAYRPDEYDDWGVIRGPEKTVDWADYPVRPHIARARNSDIQDEEYLAECRANKTDPWAGDAKLIVWLRNHTDAILTALTADKSRDEALEEVRRLKDENRDLRREQIALVEASGGEIKVPHEVLNDLPSLELIKCRFPEDMTVRYKTRSRKGAAK